MRRNTIALLVALTLYGCTTESPQEPVDARHWLKGNLHTHSFWSDGDDYPEMVIDWYKSRDYDFIALSDHNVLAAGERFINIAEKGGEELFERYRQRFPDWAEDKREGESHLARLKTFDEYRGRLEEPGSFLIIQAEEITDSYDSRSIHVNATHIAERIEPQGGTSVADVMQRNVDAVLAQRERLGQPMMPHINHPNFGWAVTVEDLIMLEGERFFEVYNGHPLVHNEGDDDRVGTERMWDILLSERISRGEDLMYGIAVDDAHNFHDLDGEHSNPGRGWVMVSTDSLEPEAIVLAMEAGDFYGSSGVTLADIAKDATGLSLRIEAEEGVDYQTVFIGTRSGYDTTKEEIEAVDAAVRFRYSDEIGEVLTTIPGTSPRYTFDGDELYVRAKVTSSKQKENPYSEGELEAAWVQPVIVER